MNQRQKRLSVRFVAMTALLSAAPIHGALAQVPAPALGTASNFAVLGGSAVTCDSIGAIGPASGVAGDVGSLTSITGFPTLCTLAGTAHVNDAAANQAVVDFHLAYAAMSDRMDLACPSSDATHNIDGDLTGLTLTPGVYCIGSAAPALLSGQLTLDALGVQEAVWIFKSATAITPIGGSVVMAGSGTACNVYWQASTLVSLNNTDFLGNILAGTAVSFTGVGSTLIGRVFGDSGVTITGGAAISIGDCGPTDRIFANGFE